MRGPIGDTTTTVAAKLLPLGLAKVDPVYKVAEGAHQKLGSARTRRY